MAVHPVRFPGESEAYRAARDRLLEKEIELRQGLETVAALRRCPSAAGSRRTTSSRKRKKTRCGR